jgi:hypothetical protein
MKYARSGCGILLKHGGRADWTRNQISAAVGTVASQLCFSAVAAEGALEGADHGVCRVRRQVLVATFAIWAQFKHGDACLGGSRKPAHWAVVDALVNPS